MLFINTPSNFVTDSRPPSQSSMLIRSFMMVKNSKETSENMEPYSNVVLHR